MNELKYTYITNAICPRCKNYLYTTNCYGYDFSCRNCDSNFYSFEVHRVEGQFLQIKAQITEGEYQSNIERLNNISEVYGFDLLSWNKLNNSVILGWSICKISDSQNNMVFPTSLTLYEVAKNLNRMFPKPKKIENREQAWLANTVREKFHQALILGNISTEQFVRLKELLKQNNLITAISEYLDILDSIKPEASDEEKTKNNWIQELEEANAKYIAKTLEDFQIGDKVAVTTTNPYNLRAAGLPAYLIGGTMTVVGFTKKKVKCDWDGGTPFFIYPDMLAKIET